MASILFILNCIEKACKIANKKLNNPELMSLEKEIRLARQSSAGQLLRAKTIQKQFNGIKSKLSHSDQAILQESINQSFSKDGLTLPFDEQGNLNVHFDDFIEASMSIGENTDIGSAVIDTCDATDVITVTPDAISDAISDSLDADAAADIAESVAEKAESLWNIISSFFD